MKHLISSAFPAAHSSFAARRRSLRTTRNTFAAMMLLSLACGSSEDGDSSTVSPGSGSGESIKVAPPADDSLIVSNQPTSRPGAITVNSAPLTTETACGVSQSSLSVVPSVLELLVDTSKSMEDPPNPADKGNGAESKWKLTQKALQSMLPSLSADLNVGLAFYPGTNDTGNACIVKRQAAEIAALGAADSSARQALITAITQAKPGGGTPTEDAFRFGVEKLLAATTDANKYLVLITDGIPTFEAGCKNFNFGGVNTSPLIDAVRDAAGKGVRTFVIGSPGSENARNSLSQMAKAGGTATPDCSDSGPKYCHFDMTKDTDLASALSVALGSISNQLATCDYRIPTNQPNLDRSKVNVVLNQSSGSQAVGRDASETECKTGWQYSADGKSVQLCDDTCELVKKNPMLQVKVLFGCTTMRQPPSTIN